MEQGKDRDTVVISFEKGNTTHEAWADKVLRVFKAENPKANIQVQTHKPSVTA